MKNDRPDFFELADKYIAGDLSPEESLALKRYCEDPEYVRILTHNVLMNDLLVNDARIKNYYHEKSAVNALVSCLTDNPQFSSLEEELSPLVKQYERKENSTEIESRNLSELAMETPQIALTNRLHVPLWLWYNPFRDSQRYAKLLSLTAFFVFLGIMGNLFINQYTKTFGLPSFDSGRVAFVMDTLDSVWSSSSLKKNQTISPGRYELREGLVRLRFPDGEEIIAEGPARFQLNDKKEFVCDYGRFSAVIPTANHHFSLTTTLAKIVPHESEFVLHCTASQIATNVVKGRIDLMLDDFPYSIFKGSEIVFNGTMMCSQNKSLNEHYITPESFEQRKSERTQILQNAFDQRNRKLDEKTGLVFRLNGKMKDRESLLLEAKKMAIRCIECDWSTGRRNGDDAFRFCRPGGRMEFYLPGGYSSLSIVMSIKIDRLNNFGTMLFSSGKFQQEQGAFRCLLSRDGEVCFQQTLESGRFQAMVSAPIFTHEQKGTWHQLALVMNSELKKMEFYLDDKLTDTKPWREPLPLLFDHGILGDSNDWQRVGMKKTADFSLDEFFVFEQALTPEEIRDLK